MLTGLLCEFLGCIHASISKETYSFVIFQGPGRFGPPRATAAGSAHVIHIFLADADWYHFRPTFYVNKSQN